MPQQFEIWIANLDPQLGTETGKRRPVIIIQTDLLNNRHPSTIICPVTTNVKPNAVYLRVHLLKGDSGVKVDCDIMVDQMRAIDNNRLMNKIGILSPQKIQLLTANLKIMLDL